MPLARVAQCRSFPKRLAAATAFLRDSGSTPPAPARTLHACFRRHPAKRRRRPVPCSRGRQFIGQHV
eukprot:1184086-Pleurochrysis_carterae.AAC.1